MLRSSPASRPGCTMRNLLAAGNSDRLTPITSEADCRNRERVSTGSVHLRLNAALTAVIELMKIRSSFPSSRRIKFRLRRDRFRGFPADSSAIDEREKLPLSGQMASGGPGQRGRDLD